MKSPRHAAGRGGSRRNAPACAAAVAALFAAALIGDAGPAIANPAGGQVVAGTAAISTPTPSLETINQSTQRAVIDWQSFNIANGQTTQFIQPSTSAMTLNRVLAADPSTIAGRLTANGSLVLVNPNGVVFSKGSQVNVNSIIATPTDISNANFMAGNMRFDRPSPNPNASVVNAGTITIGQKGLAALVAPSVANSGVIAAKLGRVVLGGAETYTLDLYGDGLINFDVGPNVKVVPLGPDGKPVTSLVSNTGQIYAPGGTVLLTADAVSGLLADVIDSSGKINAPTVTSPAGVVTVGNVTLDAGAGNGVLVSGGINVSGHRAGQTGGKATVTGGAVELTGTARISASGAAGGGTVAIGGGPHGQNPTIRNADSTTVDTGATIDASATQNGNGGTVSVWSGGTTVFNGTILAEGGPGGGNGGWVETSGHRLGVGADAVVDTLSPHGEIGTWLLDPATIEIETAGLLDPTAGSGTSSAGDVIIAASAIDGAASNVVLNASTSIDFQTAVDITTAGVSLIAQGGTVTLEGGASITLNGGSFVVQGFDNGSGPGASAASFTQNAGANINTGGGAVSINTAGAISLDAPIFSTGSISLIADTMSLGAQVGGSGLNTGAASQVTIAPATAGTAITVTSGAGSGLLLSPTDLENDVFATTLQLGNASSGGLSILSALNFSGAHVTNLTVDAAFTDLGANVTTAGGQTYSTAVVLDADETLTSTAGGNVKFFSTVDSGTAAGTFGLTLSTSGTSLFGGNVGATTDATTGAAGALKLLDVTNGAVTVDGDVDTSAAGGGSGNQTYNGAVTLGGAGTQTFMAAGGSIDFVSTVDAATAGGEGLFASASIGTVTLGGAVGTTPLLALKAAGAAIVDGGAVTATGDVTLEATGAGSISLNHNLTSTGVGGAVTLDAPVGAIAENGTAAVSAINGLLTTSSASGTTLTGANTVGTFNAANAASGNITLDNTAATLAVTGVSQAGGGAVTIDNTGNITIGGNLAAAGSTVTLTSTGSIAGVGNGLITASVLTGSAATGVSLTNGNLVGTLGPFSNTTSGNFSFTNAQALSTAGAVRNEANGGTLTLDVTGGGMLTVAGAGVSSTNGALTLAADQMDLGQPVDAGTARAILEPATAGEGIDLGTAPGGVLGLTQTALDEVTAGVLQVGSAAAGAITVTGGITQPTGTNVVTLVNNGAITELPGETLSLTDLRLSSGGSVTLDQSNNIGTVAANVTGAVKIVNGAGNSLAVGTVDGTAGIATSGGADVTLTAGGTIAETTGSIGTSGLLTTSSVGGTTLTGANTVGSFNATNTTSGNITLDNTAATLTVTGISQAGGGAVTIDNTGDLSLAGTLEAPGSTMTLTSTGSIAEGSGDVIASVLTGSAATGVSLTNGNLVGTLGPFSNTTSGNFSFTNAQALSTAGAVRNEANGGTLTLEVVYGSALTVAGAGVSSTNGTLTLAADQMDLGQPVNAGTARAILEPWTAGLVIDLGVALSGSFGLTQTALNEVTAGVLQVGSAAAGAITVTGAITQPTGTNVVALVNNGAITELPGDTLSLTNLRLSSGGSVTLGQSNNIGTVAANVTGAVKIVNGAGNSLAVGTVDGTAGIATSGGADVTLTAGGTIAETTGSIGTSGLLTTSSVGGTTLTGANTVGNFNATNATSGNITLDNTAATLTVTGISQAGGGAVTIDNTGNLSVTTQINVPASIVSLTSTGSMTLSGVIAAALNLTDAGLTLDAGTYTIDTTYTFPAATANGTLVIGDTGTTTFGALTLGSPTSILSDAGDGGNNGSLAFGAISGLQALTINAGTGTVTLGGTVGTLASLNAAGTTISESGAVTATGALTFDATGAGGITFSRNLTSTGGGAVTLDATAGPIAENATAAVSTTGLLTTSSVGGTTLTNGNTVGSFNATNTTTGDITLYNTAGTLTVTGANESGGGGVTIINVGSLTNTGAITTAAAGPITLAAALTGGTLTNAGSIDPGDTLLVADRMNLAGGTIDAGTARVVLGPFTQTPLHTITLQGAGGTAGAGLNLTNADLATITSGLLQIGANGTGYGNGTITISGMVAVPASSPSVALVSTGNITDNNAAGSGLSTTDLALVAGGGVHLKGTDPVSLLAGQSGGGDFDFAGSAGTLTIGTTPPGAPLATIALAGVVPTLGNAAATQVSGITSNGAVNLTAAGNLTVSTPISAATTVALQDGGTLNVDAAISSTSNPGGIEAEFLSDTIVINDPLTFGASGLVVLAPNTPTRGVDLGGTAAGVLELSNATLNDISAGIIQVGYSTGFAGSITVSGPVNLTSASVLGLVTGTVGATSGSISESTATPAGAIAVPSLALSAAGPVSMPNANRVVTLAGTAGGSFLFRNDNAALTIGEVDNLVTGPSAIDPNFLGVATANGNIVLETTTAGNLAVNEPVNAGTGDIALGAAGTITQSPTGILTGAALQTVSAGYTELGQANLIGSSGMQGTVAGRVLTAGQSYLLSNVFGVQVGTVAIGADAFGAQPVNPTVPPVSLASLSGVATQNGPILIQTSSTSGISLTQPVDASEDFPVTGTLALTGPALTATPGAIGLSSAGTITQGGAGLLVGGSVETVSIGSTELGLANDIGNGSGTATAGLLAGRVADANGTFLFRDDSSSLSVGPADAQSTLGTRLQGLTAALTGVTTNDGNIIVETTTSGNLALAAAVNAGTAQIALGSAGTITQTAAGLLTGTALQTVSSQYTELGQANAIGSAGTPGTIAGRVLMPGQSYLFSDTRGISVGTTTMADSSGVAAINPISPTASITSLSGVATQNGNILIEDSTGSLVATQPIDASEDFVTTGALALTVPALTAAPGAIGLSTPGTITQSGAGLLIGGAVQTVSTLSTELGLANLVGTSGGGAGLLAGRVLTQGDSFYFRDDSNSLTVGSVTLASSLGTTLDTLTVSSLSGVATQIGNVLIETTTSGNLALAQPIDAGLDFTPLTPGTLALTGPAVAASSGSVALASAGTITQTPASGQIVAGALEILSADRVSLGASGNTASGSANLIAASPSAPGTLAAQVTNPGESFVVDDAATSGLIVGTVNVADTFGQSLNAALTGVTTNAANLGLRTPNGPLSLTANVSAGTGTIGLEAPTAAITETNGAVLSATGLEISDATGVMLSDDNMVANLSGQVTGSGSFTFNNVTNLSVTSVGPVLEQGADVVAPGPQMLSVAALAGILAPANVTVTATNGAGLTIAAGGITATSGNLIATAQGPLAITGTVALDAGINNTVTSNTIFTESGALTATSGANLTFTGTTGLIQTGSLTATDTGAASGDALTISSTTGAVSLGGTVNTNSASNTVISGKTGVTQTGSLSVSDTGGAGTELLVSSSNGAVLLGGTVDASATGGASTLIEGQSGGVTITGAISLNTSGNSQTSSTTITGMEGSGTAPVIDVSNTATLTVNSQAYTLFEIPGQSLEPGGIMLAGTINVTGPPKTVFEISGDGPLIQSGLLTVKGPDVVLDSTGYLKTQKIAADFTVLTQASVLNPNLFSEASIPANPITFSGRLNATQSVVLVSAGGGAITSPGGEFDVLSLGVAGTGGTAGLFGCINSNCATTAAITATPSPVANNDYRFNTCAIGSASCTVLPVVTPTVPEPATQIDLLISQPAASDLDAPLVDIFDEERLCQEMRRVDPERAQGYCR